MTPLELADGTKIDTSSGEVIEEAQPSSSSLTVTTPTPIFTPQRLADLQYTPKQLNALGALIVYHVLGISIEETASALGTSEEVVHSMLTSEMFTKLKEDLRRALTEADGEGVRAFLASHAKDAAVELVSQLGAKCAIARRDVAKDILDRAGHRPADVVEHRHRVSGGLRIEYVEKRDLPVVEVEM